VLIRFAPVGSRPQPAPFLSRKGIASRVWAPPLFPKASVSAGPTSVVSGRPGIFECDLVQFTLLSPKFTKSNFLPGPFHAGPRIRR